MRVVNVGEIAQWLLVGGGAASLVGGAVTAFQSRAARRRLDAESGKLDAETKRVLTERAGAVNTMALGLLEPMERRIHALTTEVDELRRQVYQLSGELTHARHLLHVNQIPFTSTWSDGVGA